MPGQKLSFPGRNYLFAPGPTHIPTVVQNAMNVPMEDHRAPDFPELVKPILRDLKKVFLTKTGTPFIFPATGTAGWEAVLRNKPVIHFVDVFYQKLDLSKKCSDLNKLSNIILSLFI